MIRIATAVLTLGLSGMLLSTAAIAQTQLKASHQWPAGKGDVRDEMVQIIAKEVANANVDAIQSAQSNLQSTVEGLSDDTTVEQAAQDVQPQLQALAQAYNETFSGLDCASTLTSTSSSS